MDLEHFSPTIVFDTYWQFAAERQRVYLDRLQGTLPPWTHDPIIGTFKFTNAYRAADRVSQYLIKNVIYRSDVPLTPEDELFRILLFKMFNRIETWELLESTLGPVTYSSYTFTRYDRVLTDASADGQSIYSAAYIMPSGRSFGHRRKHRNHLVLLEAMMRDRLAGKLARALSMRKAFELLRAYPTIGDFLAYQFVTDINYSELIDFDESEFVVAGPGALDGVAKAFADLDGSCHGDIIRLAAENQEGWFGKLEVKFDDLFGRRLQYIDCQNLFCEVGKYARVAHPNYSGNSGRSRIKQRFRETGPLPDPWFPPKWGINEAVKSRLADRKHERVRWT